MTYKWLRDKAKSTQCKYIHLDSAVHRGDTHRFYFRQGLSFSSFHFREKLDDLLKAHVDQSPKGFAFFDG